MVRDLYYHIGDAWYYNNEVAASGLISYDCNYNRTAMSWDGEIPLAGGTQIVAALNREDSYVDEIAYDIWYLDHSGEPVWLDQVRGWDLADQDVYPEFTWLELNQCDVENRWAIGEL